MCLLEIQQIGSNVKGNTSYDDFLQWGSNVKSERSWNKICSMDNFQIWNPFDLFLNPINFSFDFYIWLRSNNSSTAGGEEAEEKTAVRLSLRQPQKPQLVWNLFLIQFRFLDCWIIDIELMNYYSRWAYRYFFCELLALLNVIGMYWKN